MADPLLNEILRRTVFAQAVQGLPTGFAPQPITFAPITPLAGAAPGVGGGMGAGMGGGMGGAEVGPGMDAMGNDESVIAALQAGDPSGLMSGTPVPKGAVQAFGALMGLMGLPGSIALLSNAGKIAGQLTNLSGMQAGRSNIENIGRAFGIDTSTPAGQAAASSLIDSMSGHMGGLTATSGPSGTGGNAAAAGAAAAEAALAMGFGPAAAGAASQAAANAVMGGADMSQASNVGHSAALASSLSGGDSFGTTPGPSSDSGISDTGGSVGAGMGVM